MHGSGQAVGSSIAQAQAWASMASLVDVVMRLEAISNVFEHAQLSGASFSPQWSSPPAAAGFVALSLAFLYRLRGLHVVDHRHLLDVHNLQAPTLARSLKPPPAQMPPWGASPGLQAAS